MLPHLVGGERQHRRDRGGEHVGEAPQHGLRRAPSRVVGVRAVQPVLEEVEVDRRQVDVAEVVDGVVDDVELVVAVGPFDSARQLPAPAQEERIDRWQAIRRHRVSRRIEVVQVREQEAQRVADLAVRLGDPGDRSPSENGMSSRKSTDATQSRSASAPYLLATSIGETTLPSDFDILRPDASRTWPCVTTLLIRGGAVGDHADQQRRLEPAAVLVVRLDVEVRRPRQPGEAVVVAHRQVRGAGVEPHVEDVVLLAPTRCRRNAGRRGRRGRSAPPGGRTRRRPRRRRTLLDAGEERARGVAVAAVGPDRVAGSLAHTSTVIGEPQRRWRETHHSKRFSTMPAMRASPHGGTQVALCDLLERPLAQVDAGVRRRVGGERDEVLLGGAEDHRLLAAPAVRVVVLALAGGEQRAEPLELRGDLRVRLEHALAGEVGDLGGVAPGVVDRRDDRDPLDLAGAEVVLAVPRRGVDEAGAGVEGDVVGADDDGTRSPPRAAWRATPAAAGACRSHRAAPCRALVRPALRTARRGRASRRPARRRRRCRPSPSRPARTPSRGGRRSPGWRGSSTAWSSRSRATPARRRSGRTRAAPRRGRPPGTPRRSRGRAGCGTRARPRRARCDSASTSGSSCARGTAGPARPLCRGRRRCRPRSAATSSGTARSRCPSRPGGGTRRAGCRRTSRRSGGRRRGSRGRTSRASCRPARGRPCARSAARGSPNPARTARRSRAWCGCGR